MMRNLCGALHGFLSFFPGHEIKLSSAGEEVPCCQVPNPPVLAAYLFLPGKRGGGWCVNWLEEESGGGCRFESCAYKILLSHADQPTVEYTMIYETQVPALSRTTRERTRIFGNILGWGWRTHGPWIPPPPLHEGLTAPRHEPQHRRRHGTDEICCAGSTVLTSSPATRHFY